MKRLINQWKNLSITFLSSVIAIGIVTLLMVLTTILFYQEEYASNGVTGLVMHTYDVDGNLQLFFTQINNVDLGLRSYVITGDKQYLASYNDAINDSSNNDSASDKSTTSIVREMNIIRGLTADSPTQQKYLAEIDGSLKKLIDEWTATARINNGNDKEAWNKLNANNSKQLIGNISRLINLMMDEQDHQLSSHISAENDHTRHNHLIILFGASFFYIIMGYVIKRSIQYAVQRKQKENTLINQANFDQLTGLANRNLFESKLDESIARSKRTGTGSGIFFLDLDRFKQVNDSRGHAVGDLLLQQVAERLKQSIRPYDTAARFGGDEFALIIEGVEQARDCAAIAHKIIQKIAEPFIIGDKQIDVGISIGIATCFSYDNFTHEDLMKYADRAMYGAKLVPKSDYRFYTSEINEQALARIKLERDLVSAFENKELELYYQPKLDLNTNLITGMEAFIRWNHPLRGLMLPDEFVSVAEETMIMGKIGQWVLTSICRDMQDWQRSGLPLIPIAVNLSGTQLDDDSFPEWVAHLLNGHSIASHRIILEVPSKSLLGRSEVRLQNIEALAKLGTTIHLDHFGTNDVSLAVVHELPFEAIKIDSKITQNLGIDTKTLSLVQAIIAVAHRLNLKVIASGVENEWQQACLKVQSCDQVQGFVLERPMPASYFEGWLKDKKCSI